MARRPFSNFNRNRLSHPYKQEVLAIDRIARVVKGGRRFRFRALVVLGDGQGLVGLGLSKGTDVVMAINKAADAAQRRMKLMVIDQSTVPHDVKAKVGGAQILIMPAKEGTGLIAGSVVRPILEITGYSNIYSKSLGNSNKVNCAYATIAALDQLVARSDWPAFSRPKTKTASG